MKNTILFFCIILLVTLLTNAEIALIRIENPDRDTVDYLYKNFDIAGHRPGEYLDILAGKEHIEILRDKGINFIIRKTAQDLSEEFSRDIAGYRSYNALVKGLYSLERNYPDIVKVYALGNSKGFLYFLFGNINYIDFLHKIIVVKITNLSDITPKPALIFNGVHHAREPIGSEICFYAAKNLAQNYGNDPEITNIVDNTEIWLIPQVNPDGYKIVTESLVGNYSQSWRKNLRDNDGNNDISPPIYGYYFPDGVDLNRNYSVGWSSSEGGPDSQTYPGPFAFSEPESFTIRNLYDRVRPVFSICFHTYAELILYPMGYTYNTVAPDEATLYNVGMQIHNIILNDIGRDYTVQNSADLYAARGTSVDYFYGKNRTFAYTIEIGTQFITPQSQILPICQTMFNAMKYMAGRAQKSILAGTVRDSQTQSPISATIIIPEIDYSGTQGLLVDFQTTRAASGRFYRPLEPGTYTLNVQADGYASFSTVFTITSNNRTVVNVQLNPASILEKEYSSETLFSSQTYKGIF